MPNSATALEAPYQLASEELLQRYQVDLRSGLTDAEAKRRRSQFGANQIVDKPELPLWRLLLVQFQDLMIVVLLVAALISGLVGEWLDTVIILFIVLLNGLMGAVQSYRAERAVAALKALDVAEVQVIRDSQLQRLAMTELVIGDIVLLESGMVIPADLRLLEATDLEGNEAALTGESMAITKSCYPLEGQQRVLAEQSNMAFKGSQINRGRGLGIVVAVGMATELGRIAKLLQSTEEVRTPLQLRLTAFSARLAWSYW